MDRGSFSSTQREMPPLHSGPSQNHMAWQVSPTGLRRLSMRKCINTMANCSCIPEWLQTSTLPRAFLKSLLVRLFSPNFKMETDCSRRWDKSCLLLTQTYDFRGLWGMHWRNTEDRDDPKRKQKINQAWWPHPNKDPSVWQLPGHGTNWKQRPEDYYVFEGILQRAPKKVKY